jgi:7-cyano-7-deazaguanine synthase
MASLVKKAVVLLSGGLDSTVLLYSMVGKFECYPLAISYGQRHQKEVLAARRVCEARDHNLLLRLCWLNLEVLRELLPSALTGVGKVPRGHYEAESMKSTVVPNRNMILLAVAAGYAQGLGAGTVAYAAHSGDHAIYPDCRPDFVTSAMETVRLGTGDAVILYAPFLHLTKAEIVKLGQRFTVPFEHTWSCYEGGLIHCGVCGTCTERREAFKLAGVPDPTVYVAEVLKHE